MTSGVLPIASGIVPLPAPDVPQSTCGWHSCLCSIVMTIYAISLTALARTSGSELTAAAAIASRISDLA
jgi:hypothetical protein